MWEVLKVVSAKIYVLRITPTYVGSTNTSKENVVQARDHPHVCGKYGVRIVFTNSY